MSNGMPHVKWYGRDWTGDQLLKLVDSSAKGVWIDLLCAMMQATPYGHLAVNGRPMTDDEAARLTGNDIANYKGCLKRLEDVGIPSRTDAGMLYSRRLVRDYDQYMVASESGKRGGGNPRLRKESEEVRTPEARSQKPEATVPLESPINPPIKVEQGKEGAETAPCPPICRTDHAHDWPLELVLSVAARPTVAVLPEMATAFHDHYASIGWQDASQGKRRIVDIAAKLRKWKVDQPSHGKRTQDGRPIVDNSLLAKYGMKREE
jgi:hypothetical protein